MRAALFALVLITAPTLASAYEKSTPKAAPTPTPTLPDLRGKSFMDARDRLLATGWGQGPTTNDPNKCSPGREDVCKTFPHETRYCSGSGLAQCGFVYWKDEHIAVIKTQGEEIPGMRVVSARVLSDSDKKRLDRGDFPD